MAMSRATSAISVFLGVGEAGGTDDRLHTQFAANFQVREGPLGAGEIDQASRTLQSGPQVSGDRNARHPAQRQTGVLTNGGTGWDVQRTCQAAIVGGQDGVHQHVPHAARSPSDGDGQLFQ